jgi:hypothetical protein
MIISPPSCVFVANHSNALIREAIPTCQNLVTVEATASPIQLLPKPFNPDLACPAAENATKCCSIFSFIGIFTDTKNA